MIVLRDVKSSQIEHLSFLYDLLKQRKPEQNISHKVLPKWEDHVSFVESMPYKAWHIIYQELPTDESDIFHTTMVGSVYLTEAREIGIFIDERFKGRGYAAKAIRQLIEKHPGPFLANVNPANHASILLFKKLGGKLIQHTYEVEL